MAFRFRLEKVLSVRIIEEESAGRRHVEAVRVLEAARVRRVGLEERLLRTDRELDELKRSDTLTCDDLRLHGLHRTGLMRTLAGARMAEGEAETAVEGATVGLLTAHQAREALEKLRERERTAWKHRESQREARMIDEMAVSRHRRPEEGSHGP